MIAKGANVKVGVAKPLGSNPQWPVGDSTTLVVDPTTGAIRAKQEGDNDGNSLMLIEGWCPETLDARKVRVNASGELVTSGGGGGGVSYDYRSFGYDGSGRVQTITYKTGGAGGTTVLTRTFTYDGSGNIATETRS